MKIIKWHKENTKTVDFYWEVHPAIIIEKEKLPTNQIVHDYISEVILAEENAKVGWNHVIEKMNEEMQLQEIIDRVNENMLN